MLPEIRSDDSMSNNEVQFVEIWSCFIRRFESSHNIHLVFTQTDLIRNVLTNKTHSSVMDYTWLIRVWDVRLRIYKSCKRPLQALPYHISPVSVIRSDRSDFSADPMKIWMKLGWSVGDSVEHPESDKFFPCFPMTDRGVLPYSRLPSSHSTSRRKFSHTTTFVQLYVSFVYIYGVLLNWLVSVVIEMG